MSPGLVGFLVAGPLVGLKVVGALLMPDCALTVGPRLDGLDDGLLRVDGLADGLAVGLLLGV